MDGTGHFRNLFLNVRVILKWISRNKLNCFQKTITQRICMVTTLKKKRAPSSILHEAKIAYYARNMFEAAGLVFS